MKLHKCFKHAFSMVMHSKLRSWLTILGIVIGVASVVAIVSIGEGMRSEMNSRLGNLGGDIITITPGFSRGNSMFEGRGQMDRNFGSSRATSKQIILTRTDLQVLKSIPEISYIDTQIRGNVKVSYLGKNGSVSLIGVDPSVWGLVTTLKIREGRKFDSTDSNVIIIGGRLSSSYFGTYLGINQMISIEGNSFRVIGIIDDESNNIYMPISSAVNLINNKVAGQYDSFVVKIKDENALNQTITKITERLQLARHVTPKTQDFSVTSSKQMQETRAEMLKTMNNFLIAIAAVSLIVGAVGIANTMFTSVLEKTKEIGIMKAIGARNSDIMLIFLINAGLIGLVGGIIGVIFGAILSGFLPSLMGGTPFIRETIVSLNSIIWALSVSVGIGIIAGLIPAYQASKLKPVDALRYE